KPLIATVIPGEIRAAASGADITRERRPGCLMRSFIATSIRNEKRRERGIQAQVRCGSNAAWRASRPQLRTASLLHSSALLVGEQQFLFFVGEFVTMFGEQLHAALDRGTLADLGLPALHVRIVVDVHALAVGAQRPRPDGDIRDRVFAAGDERRAGEALV